MNDPSQRTQALYWFIMIHQMLDFCHLCFG
jgi:hypothetical protein